MNKPVSVLLNNSKYSGTKDENQKLLTNFEVKIDAINMKAQSSLIQRDDHKKPKILVHENNYKNIPPYRPPVAESKISKIWADSSN